MASQPAPARSQSSGRGRGRPPQEVVLPEPPPQPEPAVVQVEEPAAPAVDDRSSERVSGRPLIEIMEYIRGFDRRFQALENAMNRGESPHDNAELSTPPRSHGQHDQSLGTRPILFSHESVIKRPMFKIGDDTHKFLKEVKSYMNQTGRSETQMMAKDLPHMLASTVEAWYNRSFRSWDNSWKIFEEDFHRAYSIGNKAEILKAQARTVRQADHEPLMGFFHRKLEQLETFYPLETPVEHFRTILSLVHTKYVPYLTGRTYTTYDAIKHALYQARDIVEHSQEGQLTPLTFSDDPMEIQKVKTGTKMVQPESGRFYKNPTVAPTGVKNWQQPKTTRFVPSQLVTHQRTTSSTQAQPGTPRPPPGSRRVPGTPAPNVQSRPTPAKTPGQTGQFGRRTLTCFNCHKSGHIMSACPEPPNQEKRNASRQLITAYIEGQDEEDILLLDDQESQDEPMPSQDDDPEPPMDQDEAVCAIADFEQLQYDNCLN